MLNIVHHLSFLTPDILCIDGLLCILLLYSDDARMEAWTAWGKCDRTCDNKDVKGMRTRRRDCFQSGLAGGKECPDKRTHRDLYKQKETCKNEMCPGNHTQ